MHTQAGRQASIWCNLPFPFFAQPRNHTSIMELAVCTVCASLALCARVRVRQCALLGELLNWEVFLSPALSFSVFLPLTFSLHLIILSPDQRGSPQSHVHQVEVCRGLIGGRIRI